MSRVKLRDIADRAGVHVSTVSRALDPATAHRVNVQTVNLIRQIADELGYLPDIVARGVREGRTATFGVVVADLGNPSIAPILRGIENNLEGRGLMAIITETQDDRDRFSRVIEHLLSRRVDALITTAARDEHVPLLHRVADRMPVVLAVRNPPDARLPHVVFDDVLGGQVAAEHLLALGHRRFAHIRGPSDASPFADRAHGFIAAVERAGADVIEAPEAGRRPTIDEGARLMRLLLDGEADVPSAVFAHNDLLALGVLAALRSTSIRCPDQIHVVGYDDTPIAEYTQPSLTSIAHPAYELGRMAAEYAVLQLEGRDHRPGTLRFPPSLVARGSTGFPRDETPTAYVGSV